MATVPSSRPRVKPVRTIQLLSAPTAETAGLVRIAVGKLSTLYRLTRLPADFGAGFRLTKCLMVAVADGMWEARDGESYDVNLAGTCECKGFFGRGRCKHLDGLRKLATLGRI
jgi:hypothetical protein